MPFRKNTIRERILLGHWAQGDTVKDASLLTGIPEGSIGYYYARFNKNTDKYVKLIENEYQDPPTPKLDPFSVAIVALFRGQLPIYVTQLIQEGDYAKARDFLELILMMIELDKHIRPILKSLDPQDKKVVLGHLLNLIPILIPTKDQKQGTPPPFHQEQQDDEQPIPRYEYAELPTIRSAEILIDPVLVEEQILIPKMEPSQHREAHREPPLINEQYPYPYNDAELPTISPTIIIESSLLDRLKRGLDKEGISF